MANQTNDDNIADFTSFKLNYKQQLELLNDGNGEWDSLESDSHVFLFVPDSAGASTTREGRLLSARHCITIDRTLKAQISSKDTSMQIFLAEGSVLHTYSQLLMCMCILSEPSYEAEYLNEEDTQDDDASTHHLQPSSVDDAKDADQEMKKYKCSLCPKRFYRPARLREHKRVHTGEKTFVCTVCQRAFSTLIALTAHSQTHDNERKHKCPVCEKTFFRKRNMELHHRLVHLKQKSYTCPICQSPYADLVCLKRHIERHADESLMELRKETIEPSNAPTNGIDRNPQQSGQNRTTQEGTANVRRERAKRDTHPKRYKCGLCGQLFARRRNVDFHIKYTHTGIKPHECEVCGKKYSDMTSFKKHIREHSANTTPQMNGA